MQPEKRSTFDSFFHSLRKKPRTVEEDIELNTINSTLPSSSSEFHDLPSSSSESQNLPSSSSVNLDVSDVSLSLHRHLLLSVIL